MTDHDRHADLSAVHPPDDDPRQDDTSDEGTDLGLDAEQDLDGQLEADEGLLGNRLRELLAPEEDLGRQTTQQVDQTLRARSVMSTGIDLLGLGWLTMRELLTDEPSRADGESEGT